MYKNKDFTSGVIDIADPATVAADPNESCNQITVNTDANAGTLTFTGVPRLGISAEPLYEDDGVTPLVLTIVASGQRTVKIPSAMKSITTTPAGLNGTFYSLENSSGDA